MKPNDCEEPNWAELDPVFEEIKGFQFVHKVFSNGPSLRAIEPDSEGWVVSQAYTGQPYDPDQYRVEPGGWDHEHCFLCWATIEDGDSYWANSIPGVAPDLCERCYAHYRLRLEREDEPAE